MRSTRRILWLCSAALLSQLSTGCYLGLTSRTVLFPQAAAFNSSLLGIGPNAAPNACGGSILGGAPAVSGPVYAGAPSYGAPIYADPGYGYGGGVPMSSGGCSGCSHSNGGVGISGDFQGGIPIASYGGTPTVLVKSNNLPSVPMAGTGVPVMMPSGGVPHDSSLINTVKPPTTAGK